MKKKNKKETKKKKRIQEKNLCTRNNTGVDKT